MERQLTFDLPVRTALGREDFFVSSANAMAVARLDASDVWANGRMVLIGPEGSGKTHLAGVWAQAVGADILDADAVAGADIAGLHQPVVIEDADRLPDAGEVALFHLVNVMRERRQPLLITARDAPARWKTTLPDLRSRMEGADLVRIEPPDDALLAAVLVKLFADRQLQVAPTLIQWMTQRMDRSFAEAQRLVGALDKAALAEGSGVTRALAQRVLDKSGRPAR